MSQPQTNYFLPLLTLRLTMLRESCDREDLSSNRTYACGLISGAHSCAAINEDERLRINQLITSAFEHRLHELASNVLPYTSSAGAKA